MPLGDLKTKSIAETNNHEVIDIPPPPYEDYGTTSTPKTHSRFDQENRIALDDNVRPLVQPSAPPQAYNQFQSGIVINSGTPAHDDFTRNRLANGTTSIFITNNTSNKPRSCFSRCWSAVLNRNAWTSCVYLLLISPVISTFAFFWVLLTFIGAVISIIFPPLGFFLGIATVWSWRALGRLDILTVRLCTIATPKPSYSNRNQFHPVIDLPSVGGLLNYGGALFSDGHTWMCFVYFVFVKSVLMLVTSVIVLHLVVLAFSPFMLLMMPVMCLVCRKFGKWNVEIAERFLLRQK